MGNQLKTVFFLGALTGLIMLIGGALGGRGGLYIAFIFATVMNFASYWFSDRIVLSLYRARRVEEFENPGLYNMVARLAQRASLPMPKLYIISTASPNAFATGRNPHNAAVAVTEGILQLLGENELEGVISHKLERVLRRYK
ncbi:MAG: M48 family metalloprotease [Thermodesulfobacteriota bacterium]|nr:M48 family metalloprotease [Thermodesulfobacteriota bacterium]